ncbi:MAG TPA: cyclic nucleotide-binding domain-containing protein, partial [bacterium]|nr:cyclic nucleotide-binding domain-containing protein [bacterium]
MLLLYKNQENLGDFGKESFEAIFQKHSIYAVKRKHVLFHEGHPALGLYFVASGRVKIFKFGRNGRPYILFFAGPGDLLNVESAYGGECTTSGEMLEDGRVGFIEKEKFNSLVGSNLSLLLRLSEMLTRRIAYSYEERVELADGRVRERMARA